MTEAINRSQLLRGNLLGERSPIRPPWSIPEGDFTARCTRCDDCISSCPQDLIRRGAGGFPQIDFSLGHCTFCGDCAKSCKQDLFTLNQDPRLSPWQLQVEFKQDCLSLNGVVCRTCGERCEESAIHFRLCTGGRAEPFLVADLCNGCGECFAACPTRSINIRPLQCEKAA